MAITKAIDCYIYNASREKMIRSGPYFTNLLRWMIRLSLKLLALWTNTLRENQSEEEVVRTLDSSFRPAERPPRTTPPPPLTATTTTTSLFHEICNARSPAIRMSCLFEWNGINSQSEQLKCADWIRGKTQLPQSALALSEWDGLIDEVLINFACGLEKAHLSSR